MYSHESEMTGKKEHAELTNWFLQYLSGTKLILTKLSSTDMYVIPIPQMTYQSRLG